ncbi:hypothetical protein MKS88_005455 [Plasmodium brasilianum]|uniref:Uncharacterized protein n=1 Tax=Plasmodium brasilianum TaxID=5824 RepID=A0ACB9Y0W1_PLABR|nr:hypothetical protein MKS88_005455 [Plasmodium brasilianum]
MDTGEKEINVYSLLRKNFEGSKLNFKTNNKSKIYNNRIDVLENNYITYNSNSDLSDACNNNSEILNGKNCILKLNRTFEKLELKDECNTGDINIPIKVDYNDIEELPVENSKNSNIADDTNMHLRQLPELKDKNNLTNYNLSKEINGSLKYNYPNVQNTEYSDVSDSKRTIKLEDNDDNLINVSSCVTYEEANNSNNRGNNNNNNADVLGNDIEYTERNIHYNFINNNSSSSSNSDNNNNRNMNSTSMCMSISNNHSNNHVSVNDENRNISYNLSNNIVIEKQNDNISQYTCNSKRLDEKDIIKYEIMRYYNRSEINENVLNNYILNIDNRKEDVKNSNLTPGNNNQNYDVNIEDDTINYEMGKINEVSTNKMDVNKFSNIKELSEPNKLININEKKDINEINNFSNDSKENHINILGKHLEEKHMNDSILLDMNYFNKTVLYNNGNESEVDTKNSNNMDIQNDIHNNSGVIIGTNMNNSSGMDNSVGMHLINSMNSVNNMGRVNNYNKFVDYTGGSYFNIIESKSRNEDLYSLKRSELGNNALFSKDINRSILYQEKISNENATKEDNYTNEIKGFSLVHLENRNYIPSDRINNDINIDNNDSRNNNNDSRNNNNDSRNNNNVSGNNNNGVSYNNIDSSDKNNNNDSSDNNNNNVSSDNNNNNNNNDNDSSNNNNDNDSSNNNNDSSSNNDTSIINNRNVNMMEKIKNLSKALNKENVFVHTNYNTLMIPKGELNEESINSNNIYEEQALEEIKNRLKGNYIYSLQNVKNSENTSNNIDNFSNESYNISLDLKNVNFVENNMIENLCDPNKPYDIANYYNKNFVHRENENGTNKPPPIANISKYEENININTNNNANSSSNSNSSTNSNCNSSTNSNCNSSTNSNCNSKGLRNNGEYNMIMKKENNSNDHYRNSKANKKRCISSRIHLPNNMNKEKGDYKNILNLKNNRKKCSTTNIDEYDTEIEEMKLKKKEFRKMILNNKSEFTTINESDELYKTVLYFEKKNKKILKMRKSLRRKRKLKRLINSENDDPQTCMENNTATASTSTTTASSNNSNNNNTNKAIVKYDRVKVEEKENWKNISLDKSENTGVQNFLSDDAFIYQECFNNIDSNQSAKGIITENKDMHTSISTNKEENNNSNSYINVINNNDFNSYCAYSKNNEKNETHYTLNYCPQYLNNDGILDAEKNINCTINVTKNEYISNEWTSNDDRSNNNSKEDYNHQVENSNSNNNNTSTVGSMFGNGSGKCTMPLNKNTGGIYNISTINDNNYASNIYSSNVVPIKNEKTYSDQGECTTDSYACNPSKRMNSESCAGYNDTLKKNEFSCSQLNSGMDISMFGVKNENSNVTNTNNDNNNISAGSGSISGVNNGITESSRSLEEFVSHELSENSQEKTKIKDEVNNEPAGKRLNSRRKLRDRKEKCRKDDDYIYDDETINEAVKKGRSNKGKNKGNNTLKKNRNNGESSRINNSTSNSNNNFHVNYCNSDIMQKNGEAMVFHHNDEEELNRGNELVSVKQEMAGRWINENNVDLSRTTYKHEPLSYDLENNVSNGTNNAAGFNKKDDLEKEKNVSTSVAEANKNAVTETSTVSNSAVGYSTVDSGTVKSSASDNSTVENTNGGSAIEEGNNKLLHDNCAENQHNKSDKDLKPKRKQKRNVKLYKAQKNKGETTLEKKLRIKICLEDYYKRNKEIYNGIDTLSPIDDINLPSIEDETFNDNLAILFKKKKKI